MKNVGFTGGSNLIGVGPVNDMLLFFECINLICIQRQPERDWSLLTDRLYKRYLRLEEREEAKRLMALVQEIFSETDSRSFDWSELSVDFSESELDLSQQTMADIFASYFRGFFECCGRSEFMHEYFKNNKDYVFEPIKVATTDIPYCAIEKSIPLSEYDALSDDDLPFWCRNP